MRERAKLEGYFYNEDIRALGHCGHAMASTIIAKLNKELQEQGD